MSCGYEYLPETGEALAYVCVIGLMLVSSVKEAT
jgi:hypothetical protein